MEPTALPATSGKKFERHLGAADLGRVRLLRLVADHDERGIPILSTSCLHCRLYLDV